MRIQSRRTLLASLSIAVLAACASTAPPQPQRTYDHIAEPTQLYLVPEAVFKNAGFSVSWCDRGRGCRETSWKEYDGDPRGALRWRERRRYSAWFEVDSLHDQYMFFLELTVQEKPPGAPDWADKPVAPDRDPEYARLLQEVDRGVRQLGGIRY